MKSFSKEFTSKEMKHKTVKLKYSDGTFIDIDEDIADLLRLMWDLNIGTLSCCQNIKESEEVGYPNSRIHIQFDNGNSVLKFINIVADYDDPNDKLILWNAIQYEDGFSFSTNIVDENFYIVENSKDFPPEKLRKYFKKPYVKFLFNVNMYFDPKYKEMIMKKLEKYKVNK